MEVETEENEQTSEQIFTPKDKSNSNTSNDEEIESPAQKKIKLSEPEPNYEEKITKDDTQPLESHQKNDTTQEASSEIITEETTPEATTQESYSKFCSKSSLAEYGLSIERETLEPGSEDLNTTEESILPLEPESIWQNTKEESSWQQQQNTEIDIITSEISRQEYGVNIERESSEEILPLEPWQSDTKTLNQESDNVEETEDKPCWQGSILKVESLANDITWDETGSDMVPAWSENGTNEASSDMGPSEDTWQEGVTNEETEEGSNIEPCDVTYPDHRFREESSNMGPSEDTWQENVNEEIEESELETCDVRDHRGTEESSNMRPSEDTWQENLNSDEIEEEETIIGPADAAWHDDDEVEAESSWQQEDSNDSDIRVVCCEPDVGGHWGRHKETAGPAGDSQSSLTEIEGSEATQREDSAQFVMDNEGQGSSSPATTSDPFLRQVQQFRCPVCFQTFSSDVKCKVHINNVHPKQLEKKNPRSILADNKLIRARNLKVTCGYCSEEHTRDSLHKHILADHNNVCKKCNKIFPSVREWCKHDISCKCTKENLEFEKKCKHCSFIVNEISIKDHVFWNHYYPKLYTMQNAIVTASHIKIKSKIYHREITRDLNKELKLEKSSDNHLEIDDIGMIYWHVELKKKAEENVGKQFIVHCSVCSAEFSDEYYFKHHLPICYKSKHFHCPFCSAQKSHLMKNNFLEHMKRHFYLSKKVVGCSECGQYFFTEFNQFSHKGKFHPSALDTS